MIFTKPSYNKTDISAVGGEIPRGSISPLKNGTVAGVTHFYDSMSNRRYSNGTAISGVISNIISIDNGSIDVDVDGITTRLYNAEYGQPLYADSYGDMLVGKMSNGKIHTHSELDRWRTNGAVWVTRAVMDNSIESDVERVTPTYINPCDYGISMFNSAAVNNPIFMMLLEKARDEGGVIKFPAGKFKLGSVRFYWSNASHAWYDTPVRGISGEGVGTTNLIFDTEPDENDEYPSIFIGGGYWLRFEDFQATASTFDNSTDYVFGHGKTDLFDMGDVGCPRLYVSNVKASGFRVGFDFWAWVGVIDHCEAFFCKYSFIYASGTSMRVSSNYAHNTWYGHTIGASLYRDEIDPANDSDFMRRGFSYSSFTSLACDRSIKSAYVIGEASVSLTQCGGEVPITSVAINHRGMIDYPPLVDSDGNNSVVGVDGSTVIDGFHLLANVNSFQTGEGLISIRRNNCKISLGDIDSVKGGSNSIDTMVTFDNVDTCYIDFRGRLHSPRAVNVNLVNIKGASINGRYISDVVLNGVASVTHRVGTFDVYTINNSVALMGGQSVYVALKGTQYKSAINTIKLSVYEISNGQDVSAFMGDIHVKAFWSQVTNTTTHKLMVNGEPAADVNVTVVASTRNTGGQDVKISFSNDSNLSNRDYMITAECALSASWSLSTDPKYLLWVE